MSRVVVVGGDAAGMTAASALHRLVPDVEVVVLERGHHTSYSACGVPYWVAGEVDGPDGLVARSPEEHRERGIDVRLDSEAVSVDVDARTVTYRDLGGEQTLGYDRLVVATGARSILPDLPGVDAGGVMTVKDLVDGQKVVDRIRAGARRAVVVGSGYIGIEMAEACLAQGLEVTVVERESTPLPIVEDEIGEVIADAMRDQGARMVTGAAVSGFDVGDDGAVTAVRTEDTAYPADLVVAAFGVAPRSELLADVADLGAKDGIVTDDQQRVLAPDGALVPDVWAAGDCVVTHDRLTDGRIHLPLGTHANKQGMVAGESVAASLGADWSGRVFPGVVQTAITKFCDLEVGRTGLGRAQADDAGLDTVAASVETTTVAGYYPGAESMTLWGLAERGSRRLLGVQLVGRGGAIRVDTAAMALWSGMTVDELVMTDLSYAPPFSSVWSHVQVLARALAKRLDQ
jgi:NADPH-dependent 2,4-dienoyl-CoA reductase/sulfur reductase-like enzyme